MKEKINYEHGKNIYIDYAQNNLFTHKYQATTIFSKIMTLNIPTIKICKLPTTSPSLPLLI